MEFIHGSKDSALFGVWDFTSGNAPKEMMENLISRYKRGKYVEGIVRQTVKDYMQSNNSLSEATNLKYRNFLSCRKYNVLCKTQSSVLNLVRMYGSLEMLNAWVLTFNSCFLVYPMKVLKILSKP